MVYGLGHKVRRNGQLNLMEAVCYPLDASPTNTGLTPPPTTNQYPSVIIPTDKVHIKLGEYLVSHKKTYTGWVHFLWIGFFKNIPSNSRCITSTWCCTSTALSATGVSSGHGFCWTAADVEAGREQWTIRRRAGHSAVVCAAAGGRTAR